METLTFSVPQSTTTTNTGYHVAQMLFTRFPGWSIAVVFVGDNGERVTWSVTDPVRAQTLLTALNKANLSVKSLERRCLEQAQLDGVISAGAVTGTPD